MSNQNLASHRLLSRLGFNPNQQSLQPLKIRVTPWPHNIHPGGNDPQSDTMASSPSKSSPSTPASSQDTPCEMVVPVVTPLASLLTPEIVAIFVGPKRKAFHLHRDLLCDRSPYFKAAFAGSFKEAEAKELFLPEDDDAAFELFVNWLYGATLRSPDNDEQLHLCLTLFALSEKLILEYLSNVCVDLIREFYRETKAVILAQDISYIYKNTGSDAMQTFMVTIAALQTYQLNPPVFLPGYRALLAEGGSFAADFSSCLLLYIKVDQAKKLSRWLGIKKSCGFHTHHYTPDCKGSSGGTISSPEEIERKRAGVLIEGR